MKMYRCNICGNIVTVLKDGGVNPVCCGQDMELIDPILSDENAEKHVPKVTSEMNKVLVEVGAKLHPMTPEHYIMMIILETDKGAYIRFLNDDDTPSIEFSINKDEKPIKAYSYCNIHSLYEAKI